MNSELLLFSGKSDDDSQVILREQSHRESPPLYTVFYLPGRCSPPPFFSTAIFRPADFIFHSLPLRTLGPPFYLGLTEYEGAKKGRDNGERAREKGKEEGMKLLHRTG